MVRKWLTIFAYHLSLAMQRACMGLQIALMLHTSVYHIEEVTSIFFPCILLIGMVRKKSQMEKTRVTKKFNFFNFLQYLLHISKNLYLIAHRVLCVTEYIPLGNGFKARYNRTIFVVFTDF